MEKQIPGVFERPNNNFYQDSSQVVIEKKKFSVKFSKVL